MLIIYLCDCYRATVEAHQNLPSEKLPPVTVTVASNDVDFVIKYVLVFLLQFLVIIPYYIHTFKICNANKCLPVGRIGGVGSHWWHMARLKDSSKLKCL